MRGWLCAVLPALLAACATQNYEARPLLPAQISADFQQRSLDNLALRAFMQEQGHPAGAAWGPAELSLAAFFFHPQLELARAQWRLARAAEISAAQRPDLGIATNAEHHSASGGGVSPWTLGFSLAVPIETGGKWAIRMERAAGLTEAARLEIAQSAWQVRSRVFRQWAEYQGVLQAIRLLEQMAAVHGEMAQMQQRRVELGLLSATELNRAPQQSTLAALATAQARLPGLRAALAEAVGVPATALVNLALSPLPPVAMPDAALQQAALTQRPDIRAALVRYGAAEAKLKLEIAKQYPDITLAPGYSFDQGDNRWSLGLSTVLTLLNKNAGPIAEADAQRDVEAQQFIALQLRVIADVEQARAAYQAALADIAGAEHRLSARQAREAFSLRQFQLGQVDRLEHAAVRLDTLAAQQDLLAARLRGQLSRGLLEDAVQVPLDGGPLFLVPEARHAA